MSKQRKVAYNSKRYKKWRKSVFRRDRHTCKLCGSAGASIQAHHIKRKHDYPHLIIELDNGTTLCTKCHYAVTGQERIFEKLFILINNHKLTLDYIYALFARMIRVHPNIVNQLKRYQKWDLIPANLVKLIKKQQLHNKRRQYGTTNNKSI